MKSEIKHPVLMLRSMTQFLSTELRVGAGFRFGSGWGVKVERRHEKVKTSFSGLLLGLQTDSG